MPKSLSIKLAQASTAGIKPDNEDFIAYYQPSEKTDDAVQLESKGIAIAIADGMSGSDGGKEASQVSIDQFLSDYYGTPESWTVKHAASKILSALNTWLYSQSQQKYGSAKGMVTTFSGLVLKSHTAHIFHVGDSRIYRLRRNTSNFADDNVDTYDLVQMTRDHRVWINNDREYLARALGIDTHLEIDYQSCNLELGDIFMLSTDGVHDFVSEKALKEIIIEGAKENLEKIPQKIIDTATENQSNDNISVQILKIESLAEPNKTEFYDHLTQLPFPPDLTAGNVLDGYKIIRELKSSSRSQVYLAEDTFVSNEDSKDANKGANDKPDNYLENPPKSGGVSNSSLVVIKTPSINFKDDPAYIDLFLHEEWVAKRVDSAHLIKMKGRNRKRSFLYTVVEYVKGQSLQQWMSDNPEPSLVQVRGTIDQIARGLRAMHRLEMIHQDLKPDNILLDESNTLKIIDFGSTKIAGLAEIKSVLEHNEIAGTANYSAPEYFKGEKGSNRSDIYSLGVIAYEMLTGELPYGEISVARADKKKFNYISARQHNKKIPDWIDVCLKKAVHPNPERRYSLLSEFLVDLSKPNQSLLNQASSQPLIERNPIAFWRAFALIQSAIVLFLLFKYLLQ